MALVEGSTQNATLATELLVDLRERELCWMCSIAL